MEPCRKELGWVHQKFKLKTNIYFQQQTSASCEIGNMLLVNFTHRKTYICSNAFCILSCSICTKYCKQECLISLPIFLVWYTSCNCNYNRTVIKAPLNDSEALPTQVTDK